MLRSSSLLAVCCTALLEPALAFAQASGSAQPQYQPEYPPLPPPPPPPPPPNTAVTVNPPPRSPGYGQSGGPYVVQQGQGRSSLEIVAVDAAYGALAGLLVGGGVALIAENDNWGRDLMVGTGAGVILGAAVGGIHAYNVANGTAPNSYAMDGLGTPSKYPPLAGVNKVVTYGGNFY